MRAAGRGGILQPPRQLPNRYRQPVRNRLNGKQGRILDASFDPAQKRSVEIAFGGERLLGQLPLLAQAPNASAEPLGNVVSHSSCCSRKS
jgi:hypothetical protein